MDDKKREKIIERYEELPEDVQRAYFSSATSDAIFEVGKKHGLEIDKMGELADETGFVMLGMTKPSEYIRNLEKRLGVEVTKAKEIAEDINQKVFSPIRESLKKIHGIGATREPVQPPVEPSMKISSQQPTPIPIPPIKPVSPISPPTPPENLPVEITPSPPPAGGPPPLTVRGGGEGGDVTEKINQILKNHEALKQARKHVMPPQPEDVKVGEIAKPIEPKVEVKPIMGGRIDTKITPPHPPAGEPPPLTVRGGGEGGDVTKEIPNIFIRNIPNNTPVTPDFVPPPKEPLPQGPKEAKNLLEKAANDPYKEPIE